MILGLVSDTHDNVRALKWALDAFRERHVDFVLHGGDLVSPSTLAALGGWRAAIALGNNDTDRPALLATAAGLGIQIADAWAGHLGGIRVAVAHGHHRPTLARAVRSGRYDLIVTGHSHCLRDETIGTTRVVNPGALYRAARYTCTVLDTVSQSLEVVGVPK